MCWIGPLKGDFRLLCWEFMHTAFPRLGFFFFLRMSVLKVIKKREVDTQRQNDKSQHEPTSRMLTKGDPSNFNLSSTMSMYTAMDGSV